jgi:hypothetical protein
VNKRLTSNTEQPFGRMAILTGSATELLALEHHVGKSETFGEIDTLLDHMLIQSLRGAKIAELVMDRAKGNNKVVLPNLSASQRKLLNATYNTSAQEARGAWFIPKEETLKVGLLSLPFYFGTYGHLATNIALEERGKVPLSGVPAAVLIWSVLEPLFSMLYTPFELRGPRTATKPREEQLQSWEDIDRFLGVLRFSVSEELSVMRYGGGWHRLRAPQQLEAKQRLLAALAAQARPGMAPLYRAYRTKELLTQYYKKAKDGRVKRKQALNKTLERTLSGFFGGDWLALLSYIGEEPHPDEQVVTALPTPRLYATGASRAAEAAAKLGIPVEEAERMAAAYWGQSGGKTPIERRVAALREYWHHFDMLHSRQRSGMKSLWGLIEDYRTLELTQRPYDVLSNTYQPGLYRALLPAELVREIDELWSGTMLPRWPERIVTEPFPHAAMAETLDVALYFWQGCALTAWFVCEGGYSRTDLAGLEKYHAADIAALKELGTPVDPHLFDELIAAEKKLGPPEPIYDHESTIRAGQGMSVTIRMSRGSRRQRFEMVRDIITGYRRAWATQYLEQYLHTRWESELKVAHREYSVMLHEKGKPPTAKQFARIAQASTNHWFGGDISALYAAIGEKSPAETQRRSLMPDDILAFGRAMLAELQTRARGSNPRPPLNNADGRFENMAQMCLTYVQLEEALGASPRRQEFRALDNEYYWSALGDDVDEAVSIYAEAIQAARLFRHGVPASLADNMGTILPGAASILTTNTKVEVEHTQLAARIEPEPRSTATANPGENASREKRSLFSRLFGRKE